MTTQKLIYAILACAILFASCEQQLSKSSLSSMAEASANASPPSDSARIIIKTAELTLQVDNVANKIKDIQSAVNAMQGHIMHYEIISNKVYKDEVACSIDSSYLIYEVSPAGFLKIKVPIQQSDAFIEKMLSLQPNIDQLLLDEEDITETTQEKKEVLQNEVLFQRKQQLQTHQAQGYAVNETAIHHKTELAKISHRTKYIWFDINLKSHTNIEKTTVASPKNLHEPFYVNALKALESGWYAFSCLLVFLLHIWPLILLIVIILLVFKKKWFLYVKPQRSTNN